MKLENRLPIPYECLVWNYERADITAIIFLNKTVHNQVLAFDEVPMNITELLDYIMERMSTIFN